MTQPEQVTLSVSSGDRRATWIRPSTGAPPYPAVVIIHDITGHRADTERHCRRFAEAGYAALAPDLYSGGLGCVVRVLASMRTDSGEAYEVIAAARVWLAQHEQVDAARIGITGFCMGGGFAVVAAADDQYAVAAPFYGATPKDAKRLEGICPTIAQYGQRDTAFLGHGRRLARHLTALDVPHDVVFHDGVGHSFMNDHPGVLSRVAGALPPLYAAYDEETEADAWRRLLAFFDNHLPSRAS